MSLLAACGSKGGGNTPTTSPTNSSGTVIDGYVAGARVFRDANGNNRFDLGESFALTNEDGFFSELAGLKGQTIVVDDNSGSAYDTVTGFPLALTMSAPGDYDVITPLTTLVVGLEGLGLSRAEAEAAIKNVFDLPSEINLGTFDPFAGASTSLSGAANAYQTAAVKVANVIMASDGDFSVDSIPAYEQAIANFSTLIFELNVKGQTIALDDAIVLARIIPNVSANLISDLADANVFSDYLEVLDGQLSFLSANADGTINSQTETGFTLIKVELSSGATFEDVDASALTLSNASGKTITSSDLVASGSRIAIFRFSDAEIRSLGPGNIGVELRDSATGRVINTTTSLTLEISAVVDGAPPSTGVDTSAPSAPPVTPPAETSSGTVIDGFIEGARAFRDLNNNNQWDSGEPFAITGALGVFSGLGGDTDFPITVDSNGGAARDVGDGSADAVATPFTGILSAPAGSTVITPITTIINEIMLDDPTLDVSTANTRVATMLKLDPDEVGDLTKFKFKLDGSDAVSNKVFTKTAFVGSAILGTAKEKGGDGATQAQNARAVAQKFADLAKNAVAIDFEEGALTNVLIELTGLGEGSSLVQRTKDSFNSATGDIELNPVQISTAARSVFDEFNDDFLTSLEASDGAELTVGSSDTVAMSGVHTVKVYNSNTVFLKTFTGTGSKFGTLKLSADELIGDSSKVPAGYVNIEVKKGNLATVQAFDAVAESVFSEVKSFFFYKGLYPSVSIAQSKIVDDVSGGEVRIGGASSDFSMSGTVTVDLTDIGLPNTYTIEKMFQLSDGTARKVAIQFIDGDGNVQYALAAPLGSFTKVSATKGTYTWTLTDADFETAYGSTNPKAFADLGDGTYSVVASFTDALGASNLGNGSSSARAKDTFNKLIIDKEVPKVDKIEPTTDQVAIGQTIEFTVTVSEPIGSIDASKIKLVGLNASSTPETPVPLTPIQVTNGMISHVSGAKDFTVTYTPTGEGKSLKLKLEAGAVKDAFGNATAEALATSGIDFDMVAPSFAVGAVKINNGSVTVVTGEYGSGDLDLTVTASEILGSLTNSNVRIVSNSGRALFDDLQLTQIGTSPVYTSKLNLKSSALGTDDTFRVVVSGARDAYGNLGAQFTSGNFILDANAPAPFSVELINSRQTYGKDQKIDIKVQFDDDVELSGVGDIYIPLTFNGKTVNAVLDVAHPNLDENDNSFVIFSYTVGNTDRSDGGTISVGTTIEGAGTARLQDGYGNLVSYDLNSAEIKLLNLGGRSIDGGSAGASLDGYIDGAIIYSDLTDNGLTSDDPIAQADSTGSFTIYGADGPLVMEGGFDISTNKDFNVRYKAPPEASIINPITTLIVAKKGSSSTYPVEEVYLAIGSPLGAGNHAGLLSYNSYAAIGGTVDLDVMTGTNSVQSTVEEALTFQKIAASVAMVADFVSTALHHSGTTAGATIADISNVVFVALAEEISDFVTNISSIDPATHLANYYGGGDSDASFVALSSHLRSMLSPIDGVASLVEEFPAIFDLLANSIIAIHNAASDFDYASNPTDFVGAAEAGINALTEIVQVQKVVQSNILSDLTTYLKSTEPNPILPESVSVSGLLGSSDLITYLQEPVGTVVPIRYSIGIKDGADATAFEGDAGGVPQTFEFNITRSGSIKTQSVLEYRISGDVTASDLASGTLSGEIFFDVNDKSFDLAIELSNDSIREGTENLIVEIFDPTETSQITNSRVSVEILDDDPSTPNLSIPRQQYDVAEGATVLLDPIAVEYFDARAYFAITANVADGSLTANGGAIPTADAGYQSAFDFKTGTVRNISFTADNLNSGTVSASAIISLSAAETYADGIPGGRQAQEQLELVFNIHRTPIFDAQELSLTPSDSSAVSGTKILINGLSVTDVDSDTLSVTVSNANADMEGAFSTTSIAPVSKILGADGSLTLSGRVSDVKDALSYLGYTPASPGELKISLVADDGDPLHGRDESGSILPTAENARMSVDFGTLKVSSSIIEALTQVGVTAADEAVYVLSADTHGVNSGDRNYVITGGDDTGWTAYSVSGSGTGEDPFVRVDQIDSTSALTVSPAPPEFVQSYVPNIKLGDTLWNTFTGVQVRDVDSDTLTLTIRSVSGDVDFRFVDNSVPGTTTYSTDLTLAGTAGEINARLENLEVQLRDDQSGLIEFELTDGDTPPVTLIPTYIPTQNAIPSPGGNVTSTSALSEDVVSLSQSVVTVSGINLSDDIGDTQPTKVKFISATGGVPVDGTGARLIPQDGSEVLLTVTSGSLSFNFLPAKDFSGTAQVEYVVIDADIPSATSAPSIISIPVMAVNDAPVLTSSGQPVTFIEGGQPLSFLQDLNISDVDSGKLSKITLTAQLVVGDQIILPNLYGFSKNTSESTDTKTVISGTTPISLLNTRDYLANIKFTSSSDNFVGRTDLSVSVSATDVQGGVSGSISKTIKFVDVNDAPTFTWSSPAAVTIGENSQVGFVIGSAGTLSDPENNILSEVRIAIDGGYQAAFDKLSVDATYALPSGVVASFDVAQGSLLLSSQAGNALRAADFNEVLKYVRYTNSNENPVTAKSLRVSVRDDKGALGTSSSKSIDITPENDAPRIFMASTGLTSGNGEAFVEGGAPARLLPAVVIEDVDDTEFGSVTISSPALGELTLSPAGRLLATANGLTFVEVSEGYRLASASEGALMSRAVLQSVLREVSFTTPDSYSGDPDAPDQLTFTITLVDPDGAQGAFTSTVPLLDAPAVQVKGQAEAVNAAFSLGEGATPSAAEVAAADPTFANVVIFNASFYARDLFYDMETATIRTETGRFVYDRSLNTLDLNKAGHVDLSKMSGELGSASSPATTTAIYGQAPKGAVSALNSGTGLSYSDQIIGSKFDDFIDGRGGYDRIEGGFGNDTILFRNSASDKGSIYDGNGGESDGTSDSDTLLLPANFAGGLVSLSALENPLNDVIVKNFENLDASPASTAVELIGNSVSNILTGGNAGDVIHLGAGGDKAAGGAGDDVFVVDISAIPVEGTAILDFTRLDKIKFTDGEGIYAIDQWSVVEESPSVSNNAKTDAWILKSDGVYVINVEAPDGSVKSVNVGDRPYGTLEKWLSTDGEGYSVIKPVLNAPTLLANRGLVTSESQPFELVKSEASGIVSYGLDLTQFPAAGVPTFTDADGDELTVSFSLTLDEGTPSGVVRFVDDAYNSAIVGNADSINASIAALKLTADQKAAGVLKISVTDGYSSSPAVKQIFFQAPNTAPEMSLTLSEGSAAGLTVSEAFSLANAEFNASDQDLSDRQAGLRMIVTVEGGEVEVGSGEAYITQTSAGFIAAIGEGDLAPADWLGTLEDILSSTLVTRAEVGTAKVTVQLQDAGGLLSTVETISVKFAPNAPPAPSLHIFGRAEPAKMVLNAAEFENATLRVSIGDLGARVGDKLSFYGIGEGGSLGALKGSVTLKASQFDASRVQPVVEISLETLFPGAADDNYEVIPVLEAAGFDPSWDGARSISVTLDGTAPDTPSVTGINSSSAELLVTDVGKIDTISIVTPSEENLTYNLVRVSDPGANWFDFSKIVESAFIDPTTGKLKNPITLAQDEVDASLLKYGQTLSDGLYAVFVSDLVGNLSAFTSPTSFADLSASPFFAVDSSIDVSGISIDAVIDNPEARKPVGDGAFNYTLNRSVATELTLTLGSSLPTDVTEIQFDIWEGRPAFAIDGSSVVAADFSENFIREKFGSTSWDVKDSVAEHINLLSVDSANEFKVSANLFGGLGGREDVSQVTIRATLRDVAGNEEVLVSREGQFGLDFTADDGAPFAQGVSPKLSSGISVEELAALSSANALNVDSDYSRVSSLYITGSQLRQVLGAAETTGEITFDQGASQTLPSFKIGGVNYYLDIQDLIFSTLVGSDGSAAPEGLEVDGLVWVRQDNLEAGPTAVYVRSSDYNDYKNGLGVVTFTSPLPVVMNALDPQDMTVTSKVFRQILDPLKPVEDDQLFSITKISDVAGNVAYASGFQEGDVTFSSLRIDVTDPFEPTLKVERGELVGGVFELDHWDALTTYGGVRGVRFSLDVKEDGDVISDVTVNGVEATVVDAARGIYFIGTEALIDEQGASIANDIRFNVTELSDNVAAFEQSFLYDQDQPEAQAVAVVARESAGDLVFDIYLSDWVFEVAENKVFEGASVDLKLSLPAELLAENISIISSSQFAQQGGPNTSYDVVPVFSIDTVQETGTTIMTWSGISTDEPFDNAGPILSVVYADAAGDVDLLGKTLNFTFANSTVLSSFIRVNDVLVDYQSELNKLEYDVDLSELISAATLIS